MKLSERLARLSLQDAPDVVASEAASSTAWSAEPSPWQDMAATSPAPDDPPAPAPVEPVTDEADPWAAGGWSAPNRWDTQDVVPPFEGVTGLGEPSGETWGAWGDLTRGADEHGSHAEAGAWLGSQVAPDGSGAAPAPPAFGGGPATSAASPLFGDTASPFLGSAADPVLGDAAPRPGDQPFTGTTLRPWDPHSAAPVEMPHELRVRYGLDQPAPAPPAAPTNPTAPAWAPAPTAPGPWDTLPPPPPAAPTNPTAPAWAPAPTAWQPPAPQAQDPGLWASLPPPPAAPPAAPAAGGWHTPDPNAAHVVADTATAPAYVETPAFPGMPPPPWAEADDPFADLRSLQPPPAGDPAADATTDPAPVAPGLPPQAEIDEALASLYNDIPPTDLDRLDTPDRKGPRWLRWARRLGKGRKKDTDETPERSCPSCGGTARVDIYDPWRGLLHMSCDSCFRMWQEVEMPEVPALPSSS
jgi:hypothetical protein